MVNYTNEDEYQYPLSFALQLPIPDDTIPEPSEGYIYLLELIRPRSFQGVDFDVSLVTITDNDERKSHLTVYCHTYVLCMVDS